MKYNRFDPSRTLHFYQIYFFFVLDLHMVIRAGILADIHKKYIIWQLLKALKYLHSAGENLFEILR